MEIPPFHPFRVGDASANGERFIAEAVARAMKSDPVVAVVRPSPLAENVIEKEVIV